MSTIRTPTAAEVAADWRESGLCRQVDPDLWWPEEGSSTAAAKALCTACEVRRACLEWAVERGERGVWGGTTENQRRAIRHSRTAIRQPAIPPGAGITEQPTTNDPVVREATARARAALGGDKEQQQ